MVRLDLSYLKNLQAIDWKGLLKMRPEAVFGLDIGSSSVKSVRLVKEDDGYTVTSAAIAAITMAGKPTSSMP
jgi:hypothetical protein